MGGFSFRSAVPRQELVKVKGREQNSLPERIGQTTSPRMIAHHQTCLPPRFLQVHKLKSFLDFFAGFGPSLQIVLRLQLISPLLQLLKSAAGRFELRLEAPYFRQLLQSLSARGRHFQPVLLSNHPKARQAGKRLVVSRNGEPIFCWAKQNLSLGIRCTWWLACACLKDHSPRSALSIVAPIHGKGALARGLSAILSACASPIDMYNWHRDAQHAADPWTLQPCRKRSQ